MMNTAERRIGRAGTISRVIAGLGLLYLALTTADCRGASPGMTRSSA